MRIHFIFDTNCWAIYIHTIHTQYTYIKYCIVTHWVAVTCYKRVVVTYKVTYKVVARHATSKAG